MAWKLRIKKSINYIVKNVQDRNHEGRVNIYGGDTRVFVTIDLSVFMSRRGHLNTFQVKLAQYK